MRVLEPAGRRQRPRRAYQSQGAIVAHRCVVRAIERDPEAFRGKSVESIESALRETLDLVLMPSNGQRKEPSASKCLDGTRGCLAEPPGGPEDVEKLVMEIGNVIASRFPWFWKKLMPCELDILEKEITRAVYDTLEIE